jgi:hypothetical protein
LRALPHVPLCSGGPELRAASGRARVHVRARAGSCFEILPPIAPGLPRTHFMQDLQEGIESATRRLLDEGRRSMGTATDLIFSDYRG